MLMRFSNAATDIHKKIEGRLIGAGLLCRVFSRGKSDSSLARKLELKEHDGRQKYSINGRKIQDAIGIRVILYFPDDIQIAESIISAIYMKKEEDCMIDKPEGAIFTATRYNLVYQLPDEFNDSLSSELNNRAIDSTFEVQIRTILSEGWHEVEHDLRYKNKDYWEGYGDLNRALNGIVAALETSEWSMQKIFEELCYQHYKARNWPAMITLKLRLRMEGELSVKLNQLFDDKPNLGKSFLRENRTKIIRAFEVCKLPVTIDNAIYIWNYLSEQRYQEIEELTPSLIIDKIKKIS